MNMAMLAYLSPTFIVKPTPLNAVGLRLNATPGHTALYQLGYSARMSLLSFVVRGQACCSTLSSFRE